jgi:hypothetical protein
MKINAALFGLTLSDCREKERKRKGRTFLEGSKAVSLHVFTDNAIINFQSRIRKQEQYYKLDRGEDRGKDCHRKREGEREREKKKMVRKRLQL